MRIFARIMISAVFFLGISCGVYTFSPSALGGIKSIAIPLFENQTLESGVAEKLTDALAEEFVADNTLRVVPEGRSDSILRGSVVSYGRDAYTYDESEAVSEYIVRIEVDVQFVESKSDKIIWEERLSNWGTYESASETEETGQDNAIIKLVEDILNRTVKGW
ncbi:MAG: LptE family protein [Candidatus Zixiibacteriota bacterium]|nr:MAG: LptE family protein [candidate division Zixibacteria bacterium]